MRNLEACKSLKKTSEHAGACFLFFLGKLLAREAYQTLGDLTV